MVLPPTLPLVAALSCRDWRKHAHGFRWVEKDAGNSTAFPMRGSAFMQCTPTAQQPVLPNLWQRVMLALVFSQLIEVQAEYHRKSLALLQAVLPQIKAQQGKCQPSLDGGLTSQMRPRPPVFIHPYALPNRVTCR